MLAWLVSLLIAGPQALIASSSQPHPDHAQHPRIQCVVQHFGDPKPQRCPARVVCTSASKHLVGHRMMRGRRIARRYGCTVRVAIRNGKHLFLRADLQPNRINVAVRDGRITRVMESVSAHRIRMGRGRPRASVPGPAPRLAARTTRGTSRGPRGSWDRWTSSISSCCWRSPDS